MEMSVYDWIYQIVVEGAKYIILAHWFFGFEFRKKKTGYLLVLYLISIPLLEYSGVMDELWFYYCLWGFLIIVSIFEGSVLEKIKLFFVIWFAITFIEIILMVQILIFTMANITEQSRMLEMIIGVVSSIFLLVMVWKAKKLQNYIKCFWKQLSNLEYVFVMFMCLIIVLILGGIQSYFYDKINFSIKELILISGVFAICVFIIVSVLLLYTKQSKKRLEEVNKLNVRYLELQRKYYENSFKQYEDMRSFQHEINHHVYILSELCKQNRITELKEYIIDMGEKYENIRDIHVGNFMADCIISHTVSNLREKENFQFYLDGHFPKKMFLEDIDFCILLSNLLDNAKEALEKVEGERTLQIEVKNYKQKFYLIIRNNVEEQEIDFQNTDKLDKKYHGYGIQNVRRIVEKYHGTVVWSIINDMVEVKVLFDRSKLD